MEFLDQLPACDNVYSFMFSFLFSLFLLAKTKVNKSVVTQSKIPFDSFYCFQSFFFFAVLTEKLDKKLNKHF